MGIWALAYWGLGEMHGLLVPPGKASKLLTDHMITHISFIVLLNFVWVVKFMKHILSVMTS